MKNNAKKIVLLGLLTAILLLMSYTPLGYLNIGPLAITLNVIPVAIAAVTMGPVGGAIVGAIFGLTSFMQCIGIGGTSPMGVILLEINPFLTFVLCFVPRMADGLLTGVIFNLCRKKLGNSPSCFAAGFSSAFINTALFMTSLVLLFGNTDYVRELIAGRNILLFICTFVGINAIFEMLASTVITGAVGTVLFKARLVPAVGQVNAKENSGE